MNKLYKIDDPIIIEEQSITSKQLIIIRIDDISVSNCKAYENGCTEPANIFINVTQTQTKNIYNAIDKLYSYTFEVNGQCYYIKEKNDLIDFQFQLTLVCSVCIATLTDLICELKEAIRLYAFSDILTNGKCEIYYKTIKVTTLK